MSATEKISDGIRELQQVVRLAEFASTCCDKAGDRMYHAADGTWWRRDGSDPRWVPAEPPKGWRKEEA